MSKLGQQLPTILSALDKSLTPEERNTFVTCAIARAVSLNLQLPTSSVNSAEANFADVHTKSVMETLSHINEGYIIDTDAVYRAVRGFYLLRYNLVFNAREQTRVISAVALQSPDKLPGNVIQALAKFNTAEVEEQFNIAIWTCLQDA